ncbi:MAG: 50S ribosomal protein P1 [Candidatus Freyrarchaeum guaymaensis]|nr:50S ribosomal protein P1 [Candidatus Sigynarchaeota archaeon]HDO80864.1 50S ribosomal protein P1 [Candidatus Bathyarchaeota archaeon]
MEYVYAAMLLHKAGKEITEENVAKVLEAAGVETDMARAKALVAALEEVDIEEAIKTAAPTAVAVTAPAEAAPEEAKPAKEEEKKEEKEEEEEVAGLGALFG